MAASLTITLNMDPVSPRDRDEFMTMAEKHFRELNPAFEPHADWKAQYFENVLQNSSLFLRWIEVNGKRAGFILFGIEDHRFLPRRTGGIYELYIEPDFRRNGIARQCAAAAICELEAHSPAKIQLEIMDGNGAAKKLWASLGFRKFSERWVLRRTNP